ncbi:MAG: hypothetical protein IPL79_08155 [Myxococcales bacterium]|nr:hypothetical protein [Myxococcales bacterium]
MASRTLLRSQQRQGRPALRVGLVVALLGLTVAHSAVADTSQWAQTAPPAPGQLQGTVSFSQHTWKADIYREQIGGNGSLQDALPTVFDLESTRVVQQLTAAISLGLPGDFWLTAALPITLSDSRTISRPTAQAPGDNTTVADEFLPADGFDAASGGGTTGDLLFAGAPRSGIDQLELGVGWVAMRQGATRHDHDWQRPTWTLGMDWLVPIGETASFSRAAPDGNTAVGTGTHDIRFRTAVSQRYGAFTPYWQLWYQAPLGNRSDSLFSDPGFGARNSQKQQLVGVDFGVKGGFSPRGQRYDFELGGSIVSHFEGRGYSELWEVLAYAGDADASGPLRLDADPSTSGVQALSHPGVSYIENYLELQGTAAVHATFSRRFSLGLRGRMSRSTNHFITFADAGVDLPTCQDASTGCEANDNTVVTPNTSEVNPAYASRVDLIGHRYRAEGGTGLGLFVEARGTF